MNEYRTTICGIGIALCQSLMLVPYLAKWSWAFQASSILFTAALGVFAADAKKKAAITAAKEA